MREEFEAAENLLEKAGLWNVELPIPLDAVMAYLKRDGLELRYYNPRKAPVTAGAAASSVDEVLLYQEKKTLLCVNQGRSLNRQRFSIFHGIGHFLLPAHRGLNYLAEGCITMNANATKPFERQADRFAAALNMPVYRFRRDMAHRAFGMETVETLSKLYSASVESAAIHYIELLDIPCALLWLEREYAEHGMGPDSHLRVRYQVSGANFPFHIQPGTAIPRDSELFWRSSQEEYFASGVVNGEDLGLQPGTKLWVDCYPQNHIGTVVALVCPGDKEPTCTVDPFRVI